MLHFLHFPSLFVVVHTLQTAAAIFSGFFLIYLRHLCIPAADLVLTADGLGLRVIYYLAQPHCSLRA